MLHGHKVYKNFNHIHCYKIRVIYILSYIHKLIAIIQQLSPHPSLVQRVLVFDTDNILLRPLASKCHSTTRR